MRLGEFPILTPEVENPPALALKVSLFYGILFLLLFSSVPTSAIDFNCDFMGRHGDVDVVFTNGEEGIAFNPKRVHREAHLFLSSGECSFEEDSLSAPAQSAPGLLRPTHSIMSAFNLVRALLFRHPGPLHLFGTRPVAPFETKFFPREVNSLPTGPDQDGYFINADSAEMELVGVSGLSFADFWHAHSVSRCGCNLRKS